MRYTVRQRTALLAAFCILCPLLIVHFVITYLHLSPLNPLKVAAYPLVSWYTSDVFAQNWSLFAPNPIHHNSTLLVQCRIKGGEETAWFNISEGMNDGHDRNPVGPYGRLVRMHVTATRTYNANADMTTEQLRETVCERDPDSEFCLRQDEHSKRIRAVGEEMLTGLGSAACSQVVSPGQEVEAVRFRMLTHTVRPWSKRNDPDWQPTVTGTETDWLAYRKVAPINMRLVEAGEYD